MKPTFSTELECKEEATTVVSAATDLLPHPAPGGPASTQELVVNELGFKMFRELAVTEM